MAAEKPTIPKGTRDFGPEQMAKRNLIFDAIKGTFQKYGFMPLETPSMENLSVLTGKYGDEGDQLLFKILNSGDYLSKTTPEDIAEGSKKLTFKISEKGLRYDLTVPFARYVVMNRGTLTFPFKRFQLQPVWRADRPQKGRYREFFQCDADVVGTDSLICEAEIVLMINEVLGKLGITDYDIKMNNRKVLAGIAEHIGAKGNESALLVAIDKLDKIGREGVEKELLEKGFSQEAIDTLFPLILAEGSNEEKFETLATAFAEDSVGAKGVAELREVFDLVGAYGLEAHHGVFDISLARGLSYYTGCIFEVKVNNVKIGSISGGGRYDDLTGVFGMPDMSGVGFSFGVDRIYDVMEALDLFPAEAVQSTQVMIVNFDPESARHSMGLLTQLRAAGIKAEIYPDAAKMKKQLTYANKKGIPYVMLVGSQEVEAQQYALKDMVASTQETLAIEDIVAKVLA